MELSFILVACRRYWYVVVLSIVLACGAGILLSQRGVETFQAEALANISPPSGNFEEPDRYIAGQLVLLNSAEITNVVADRVGVSPAEVGASRLFNQVAGTNVVRIQVDTSNAERSAEIADAYLDVYFEQALERLAEVVAPQLAEIDRTLEENKAELEQFNAQIEQLLNEFNSLGVDAPPIEQLDAQLASDRTAAIERRNDLAFRRAELALGADSRLTSRVLQRPVVPTELTSTTSPLLPIAGLLLGAMMGVAFAALLAQSSKRVLNDRESERILGHSFLGEIPKSSLLARPIKEFLTEPALTPPVIQQANIRVQASRPSTAPLSVLVVGVGPRNGVTTAALLAATHFARRSFDTILVDANGAHPDLSDAMDYNLGGPSALVNKRSLRRPPDGHDMSLHVCECGRSCRSAAGLSSHQRTCIVHTDAVRTLDALAEPPAPDDPLISGAVAETSISSLWFLGIDRNHAVDPQLVVLPELIGGAPPIGRVTVIDGGGLMDSASTLQLAHIVDSIILVVPPGVDTAQLKLISGELAAVSGPVVSLIRASAFRSSKQLRAAGRDQVRVDGGE